MKLENQVCSLELSKRLRELGVKQESLFYWWGNYEGNGHPSNPFKKLDSYILVGNNDIKNTVKSFSAGCLGENSHVFNEKFSAFTVAELGEMLPFETFSAKQYYGKEWGCKFKYKTNVESDTEADARAAMLVYLLENNLIKLT